MRDEAYQVWGLRATIAAMRPLTLTTPHILWPFRRWRARPTPWSSDLKLGSLNLTPIPCKCSATVRPSGQKAVAGIVHSRYKPLLRKFLTRARSTCFYDSLAQSFTALKNAIAWGLISRRPRTKHRAQLISITLCRLHLRLCRGGAWART